MDRTAGDRPGVELLRLSGSREDGRAAGGGGRSDVETSPVVTTGSDEFSVCLSEEGSIRKP